MRILLVANKALPEQDYRIAYRQLSQVAQISFGLPGRPQSLASDVCTRFDFGEGLRLHDLHAFGKLLGHLRRHRQEYDAVHFFSTKLQLLGPVCAALAGIPSLITITGFGRVFNRHGSWYVCLRWPYLLLAILAIYLSRAVLFQNRGDMEWLSGRFPWFQSKMFWVGSGVSATIVTRKDFHAGPLRVLLAARLMPDKGIDVFLEAAARLQGGPFQFYLAGPVSDGQQELGIQVQRAHERGQLHYLGELSSAQLAAEYGRSHVFVHPSRGEGMPRVMLEAGHYRLCPVASDIPAHRDLVKTGSGLLLDSAREVDSLVELLEYLQSQRAECEGMAKRYQQQIVKDYSSSAYAERMDTLLRQLFPADECNMLTSRLAG